MSIFRRDNPEASPTHRPLSRDTGPLERKRSATYVANGSKFNGEVTGSAEVLIDGEMEGRLQVDSSVTIGQEGVFQGEVVAQAVRVEGKLQGNVRGRDLVEVTATGRLEGDIAAARVVIAEGAFFKGNVEMSSGRPTGQQAAEKPSKASGGAPQGGSAGGSTGTSNRKGGA
jgi:cytoskeletal protein CcmA (bactofilin family)